MPEGRGSVPEGGSDSLARSAWNSPLKRTVPQDLARAGFENLNQFGERNRSGETAKNMDMIRHSSDLKRSAVQGSQSCGQISVCLRSAFRGLQKWTSIFGGENYVDQDQGEGLSHAFTTQDISVIVMLHLAPLQGSSSRGPVPRVETLG